MLIERFSIEGPCLLTPKRRSDARGWFAETWRKSDFERENLTSYWPQDNQSMSIQIGTIRGLHWQIAPFAQAKLVGALMGAIFDVAVDLRRSSPTFGQSIGVTLDSASGNQLYIPIGFAHGFCTLEANTRVAYKVGAEYCAPAERALAWDDPDLNIAWPLKCKTAIVSEKDSKAPRLSALREEDCLF